MNDKVRNILAGIGVAGMLTTVSAGAVLIGESIDGQAEKQAYISSYYNQQLEQGVLSDRDIAKYETDNTYTGFIKDEEVLKDIQQIEQDNQSEAILPLAIATGVGLATTPLILFDKSSDPEF